MKYSQMLLAQYAEEGPVKKKKKKHQAPRDEKLTIAQQAAQRAEANISTVSSSLFRKESSANDISNSERFMRVGI